MCNRVRDVSHRDESSDGYVLGKWMMCQGTFANAHFAGKLQADRVWEGGRGGKPPPDSSGEGRCVPSPLWQCLKEPQITWYNIPLHCKTAESFIKI